MKHIRMPHKLFEKWVAALRSGQYTQGIGTLCNAEGSYCCLGVLQVVADGDVERTDGGTSRDLPTTYWLDKHDIEFRNKKGYIDRTPFIAERDATAVTLNDDIRATFPEIADELVNEVEFTDELTQAPESGVG